MVAPDEGTPHQPRSDVDEAVRQAITTGIPELFGGPGGVTNEHFTDVVSRYPGFLTPEGRDAVHHLATTHPVPEGREALTWLYEILTRTQQVGVGVATAEARVDTSDEAREARLEAEREGLEARRRSAPVRSTSGPGADLLAKGPAFDSLDACLQHIATTYPQSTIAMTTKDVASHTDEESAAVEAQMPAYMYRGESGLYASTLTSLDRLLGDLSLSARTIETIVALSLLVRDRLVDQLGLSPRLAAAFLQHYGAPTDLFDLSPDLEVAVEFATNLAPGDWGAIAVVPVEAMMADPDGIMLADLTRHPMASRPRRQSAYAYHDYRHRDLKAPQAIDQRRIAWHWFRFTADDEPRHRPNPSRLDARSDGVAGFIEIFVNDAAPFDDGAARWMSEHVPAAPTVMRVLEQKDDYVRVALVPLDDAGQELVPSSTDTNYRRWSELVAPPSDPGPSAPGDADAARDLDLAELTTGPELAPGATLWVLRSRVLQQLPRADAGDSSPRPPDHG